MTDMLKTHTHTHTLIRQKKIKPQKLIFYFWVLEWIFFFFLLFQIFFVHINTLIIGKEWTSFFREILNTCRGTPGRAKRWAFRFQLAGRWSVALSMSLPCVQKGLHTDAICQTKILLIKSFGGFTSLEIHKKIHMVPPDCSMTGFSGIAYLL